MSKEITPFSIEAYQSLVVEQGTHHVETRDGNPVRILCTDAKNEYPILTLTTLKSGTEVALFYTNKGIYKYGGSFSNDLHLAPNAPKSLGWVNVYAEKCSEVHKSRERADHCAQRGRLACKEIFEGEGLEPATHAQTRP